MMATIQHRGPNSDGMYTNDKVALGFRRLSIIDLRGGSQPIYNEDRLLVIDFWIVKGRQFRTCFLFLNSS